MDRGAVFVEALVAAAIVAMILAATLRVISDGAAGQRMMEDRRMALLVAQSELATVGADIPVEPGDSAGFAGNLVWRVDISPYEAAGGSNSAGALMKVRVSVRPRAGGADLVVLDSLRLGRGG
jgi:type II secretion system protein I